MCDPTGLAAALKGPRERPRCAGAGTMLARFYLKFVGRKPAWSMPGTRIKCG
jgi:hypothetical protein